MSLINTSQAVQELFGMDGKCLRTKANSYVRNGTIPSSLIKRFPSKTGTEGKESVALTSDGVSCLFNALVLDAFYNDTKKVKSIFEKWKERKAAYEECLEGLLSAQQVNQLNALEDKSRAFLQQLSDETFDLRNQRLTNPFSKHLPQIALTNGGLLYELLRNSRLSLSLKDALLLASLENDLEKANCLSLEIDAKLLADDPMLSSLVERVQRDYQEALSFQSLLNLLPD